MRKSNRVSLLATAGFVLFLAVRGFAAETTLPEDGLSNDPNNPGLDTFLIKCKGKTTICADVESSGFYNDNTVHVSVICVAPGIRKGFGALAYGVDGAISTNACVTECTEAVVAFQCEVKDQCDENYQSTVECVDREFVSGYPKRRQE